MLVMLMANINWVSTRNEEESAEAFEKKTDESRTKWAKEKIGLKEDAPYIPKGASSKGAAETARTTNNIAKEFKDAVADKASKMAFAANEKISGTIHTTTEKATEAKEEKARSRPKRLQRRR